MKKLVILFVFVLSASTYSQPQDKFLIGVDWINPTDPWPWCDFIPLSPAYWDTVQSLGINFGRLTIGTCNNGYLQLIEDEMLKANSRGISTFLETFFHPGGRRWMYQVEDDYDFSTHDPSTGSEVHEDPNPITLEPEPHWSQVRVNNQAPNLWRSVVGTHQPGYVAEDVIDDDLQPDGTNYYVRLKLRKTDPIITHTPILEVRIYNKTNSNLVWNESIYADDLIQNEWTEKYLPPPFFKSATAPYDYIEGMDNVVRTDTSGLGNSYFTYTVFSNTPYEIKIEWFGDVSCDLDYLIIEDDNSYSLHNGSLNYIYENFLANVAHLDGLGKIKIWEEPWKENYLFVRKEKSIVDNYLSGTPYEDRSVLTFQVPSPPYNAMKYGPPQQFSAQTRMSHLFSDIYPIPYYYPNTMTPFVIPGEPNYTTDLQYQLNQGLTGYLESEIIVANRFEKQFWYIPQAHEWNVPPDQIWHREPSAYEIRAMTNLGVCYGAKGIYYFMYSSIPAGKTLLEDDNINQPLPRYEDYYLFPKWKTVKNLNQQLAAMGDELMSLTWQNSVYIHDGTQPTDTYVTNIESLQDIPGETYIQFGLFKSTDNLSDQNLEHFYIVNRRTNEDDQRDIEIQYDKSTTNPNNFYNWTVKEAGTTNYWSSASPVNQFTTTYEPGDGKLFNLQPTVMGGGDLLYNETINSDIELHGDLFIEHNVVLSVNENYDCYGNIILNSNSHIEGTGKINFYNGKGIIVNGDATVIWGSSLNDKLEFDFVDTDFNSGIFIQSGGFLLMNNAKIYNSGEGVYTDPDFNYVALNYVDFINCSEVNYNVQLLGPSTQRPWINHCTFYYSYGAVFAVNFSEIVIQNCQMTNTDATIYLGNVTQPSIIGNIMTSNKESMPALFLSSSDGLIYQNSISGYSNAIVLANASPSIGLNQLTNNLYHAIYVGTGSYPDMTGQVVDNPLEIYAVSGYNNIVDNGGNTTGGPADNDGSEIFINTNANVEMSGGCNSVVDNRVPGGDTPPFKTKLLMNSPGVVVPIEVYAEANYWGSNPLYRLEERFGNLLVHYQPYYNQPCQFDQNASEGLMLTSSNGEIIDTLHPLNLGVGSLTTTELLYASADKKYLTADYTGAEEIYNQIISSNDSLSAKLKSYRRLYEIGKLTSRPASYFNDLYNTFASLNQSAEDSIQMKIFSQLGSLSLVGQAEYVPAIGEFDNIIQNNPGTEEAVYAEIDALTTALLFEPGDTTLGKSAAGKYIVNSNDYNKRVNQLIQKNFGSKNETKEEEIIPTDYVLYQNYPNPFNPITTIKYDLPNSGNVSLIVYDILGRKVTELVNTNQQAGRYEINFDASKLASGVYIYQLRVNDFSGSKKMILLR